MSTFLFVALISAGVAASAWLVAARFYPSSPIESVIAAGVYALALTCGPILVLGWADLLYAKHLALFAIACSAVAALAALWPEPQRHLRNALRLLGRATLLPISALARMAEDRSLVALGLIPMAIICVWTAWLSYLAPQSGWDGLWYHDPIVGFAIQNHGFRWVDLPHKLALANGYPKISEMLGLWFVIFSNRALIELPSSLLGPLAVAAIYQLLRHCGVSRPPSLALAITFFLMPAFALELRSTYVDSNFTTVAAMALVFLTRPILRKCDILTAGLALGLVMGMKSTGAMLAPLCLAILTLRIILAKRFKQLLPALAVATVLIATIGSPFYIRNYERMGNPVYPAELEIKALGIKWDGLIRWRRDGIEEERAAKVRYTWPKPGQYFHDIRVHGYGKVLPWCIALAALGALVLLTRSVFERGSRLHNAVNILVLSVALMGTILLSPASWWARLNMHSVIGFVILVGVAMDLLPHLLREILATTSIAVSLAALYPLSTAWGVSPQAAEKLATWSPEQRSEFRVTPAMAAPAVARARERELTRGTIAAFAYPILFPALLWNERFDNQVVSVDWHGRESFMAELNQVHAKWVVFRPGSKMEKTLRTLGKKDWQRVGKISREDIAYRRLPSAVGKVP